MIPDHFTQMNALRVFCVTAEARSIELAAQRLNMSPLSVRRQISVLENVLETPKKTQLFTECEGQLVLTERGERLYLSVHQMFQDIQAHFGGEPDEHANVKNHLRVCTSTVFGSFWLMPLLPEFMARYPDIRLTLIVRDDDARLNLNEADVLISWNILQQPLLISTKIGEGRLRAYGSRSYIREFGEPRAPEDLDHHRIIAHGHHITELYNALNPTLWLLTAGRASGSSLRSPFFTVNNAHCILQAVQNGIGIGPLHQYMTKKLKDLVEILPQHSTPVARYLCYPEYLKHVSSFQLFRDFVIEKISTHPL